MSPALCGPIDCGLPGSVCCLWDLPGKNTGVGCHCLLQGTLLTQGSNRSLPHWQAGSCHWDPGEVLQTPASKIPSAVFSLEWHWSGLYSKIFVNSLDRSVLCKEETLFTKWHLPFGVLTPGVVPLGTLSVNSAVVSIYWEGCKRFPRGTQAQRGFRNERPGSQLQYVYLPKI